MTNGVQFDEEASSVRVSSGGVNRTGSRIPRFTAFVISLGWATNEREAERVLLILVGIAVFIGLAAPFLIGGYRLFPATQKNDNPTAPYNDLSTDERLVR